MSQFVEIDWNGRRVRIEHTWLRRERRERPLIVFLHEGLGSVSMWRDFPKRLAEAADCRVLVYSRPGFGKSTSRAPEEVLGADYLHRQAHEVLPALLESLGVDSAVDRPWLFGHSDGGSIALLYAARFPDRVSGCIVLAPHIFVEDLTLQGLKRARQAYLESDVRQRLARHHEDPDSVFWGWNHTWLHPLFKSWNIEADISPIRCPVLAVQGLDDEYGSLEQIRGIARLVPHTRLLELSDCGHSPYRDQPERVIDASMRFMMAMQ